VLDTLGELVPVAKRPRIYRSFENDAQVFQLHVLDMFAVVFEQGISATFTESFDYWKQAVFVQCNDIEQG
jgi:hypothetical protein